MRQTALASPMLMVLVSVAWADDDDEGGPAKTEGSLFLQRYDRGATLYPLKEGLTLDILPESVARIARASR